MKNTNWKKTALSIIACLALVFALLPAAMAEDTTYPYAVVDTEAGTVTIDGTLGGKTEAAEEDITALVAAIQGYVDSGITTIIVPGTDRVMYHIQSATMDYYIPVFAEAIYRLADDDSESLYCGTIDLILPDVTEVVNYEYDNACALKSITLPKVTTVGDGAFYATQYLQTITFGSVVTAINQNERVAFHMVGYEVGGCDLVLNCGQANEGSPYIPDFTANTWYDTNNTFKSITLTHTPAENATYTDLGDGTHSFTCTVCDTTVTEAHTMDSATGKCVCGTNLATAKVGDSYYTDFATALANWTDNTTLTLLTDVTGLTEQIEISGNDLVLDLNGKLLESTVDNAFKITSGELTIRDSVGTGSLTTTDNYDGVLLVDNEDAIVHFESGTLESVYVMYGTFNMTGGKIYTENWIAIGYFAFGTVNISGGEVTSTSRDAIHNNYGTLTVTGTAKITSTNGYAISNCRDSNLTTVSGDVVLSGSKGEFYLGKKIVLNTQPTGDTKWDVSIETGANTGITNGVFAIPGEGVTLDADKFASAKDGYEVGLNAKGRLLLCNHTGRTGVSNDNGTHDVTCYCGKTTFETNVACSGGVATDTHQAYCVYCNAPYGELNPDGHCDVFAVNMTAEELRSDLLELLNAGKTDILIILAPDADEEMFIAINTALRSSTADGGSVDLTIAGARTVSNITVLAPEGPEAPLALKTLTLPDATALDMEAIKYVSYLEAIYLPNVTSIGAWGLDELEALNTLVLSAEGTITFSNFDTISLPFANIDLTLHCDKKNDVTDGTTWQGETWKSISFTGHDWTDGTCTSCGEVCAHSGGTATCTERAKCATCGASYGEVDANKHSYTSNICCGYCGAEGDGTNVTWTLVDGAFTLSGTGAMVDYSAVFDRPWHNKTDSISSVSITEGLTNIGKRTFLDFDILKNITIPASVEALAAYAFSSCNALETVTFAEGSRLTTIDQYAFQICSALKQITIPAGVTAMDENLFYNCSALSDVFVAEGNTAYKSDDGVLYTAEGKTLIHYPAAKEGESFTIPTSVTRISENAFRFCANLTIVNVPCSWDGSLYTFEDGVTVKKTDHSGGTQTCMGYKCEICGTWYGEVLDHIDSGKDHECDYGCETPIGKHADSATDADHVCDYGCGAVLEKCSDADGDKDHACDICGEANITEHTYTDATCEAPKTCAECGATEGEKLGHDWTVTYTWSEDGKSCTAKRTCGNDASHNESASATVTSEVTKDPTCTDKGETTYTATFTVDWAENQTKVLADVAATGHSMKETAAAVAPTCEKAGKTAVLTCANGCGKTEGGAEVAALGHDMKETAAAVAPTCEKAGKTAVLTCANGCGKTEGGAEVAALGHSMKETAAAVEPTCEKAGKTAVLTCANGCGKTEGGAEVAALGHVDENKDNKCDRCGAVLCTDGSHIEETVSGKAATCTEDGLTEGKECSACGKVLVEQEVIPALGHDYDDGVVTKEPTTTEVGEKTYTCQREGCGHTKTEEIPVIEVEVKLDAPTVKVINIESSGKIKLTWNKVDGAEKYEVYRSTTKEGEYTLLTTTTRTSVSNTKIAAGETYYYKVRAIAGDVQSEFSEIVGRTCDLAQPKVKATNIASTGKIKLSWDKVDGAVQYEVWRAKSENGTYTLLGTTTKTSITNGKNVEAGETYYYKVKAIAKSSAANSAYSGIVGRTCDLAQPTVKTGNVASTGKITISWNKVEGAVKYEVYRSTTKDGGYTLLTTTTKTSITNSKIAAGETYYYIVRAIASTSSANSAYSTAVGRTCDLARPEVTVKLNSNGKPVISWTKVAGAVRYAVYRATSENGEYTLLGTTTKTSVINGKNVEAGVTYYYRVRAIAANSAANSAYSAVAYITAK